MLGMDVSPDNSILVTADTEGFVAVWDIEDYCVSERTTVRILTTIIFDCNTKYHNSSSMAFRYSNILWRILEKITFIQQQSCYSIPKL